MNLIPKHLRIRGITNEKKQLEFADGIFVSPHEIPLACENDVLCSIPVRKIFGYTGV
jgi:hypothetical protein